MRKTNFQNSFRLNWNEVCFLFQPIFLAWYGEGGFTKVMHRVVWWHCKFICDDVKVQNPLGVTSKSYKNPLGIVGHLVLTLHKVKRKQEEIVLTGKYGIFERWSDLLSWFLSLLAITLLKWLLLGAHLGHLDALSTKFAATMSVNSALLVLDWVALLRTTVASRKVVAAMYAQRKSTALDWIVVPTSIVVSQISWSVVMEFVDMIALIGTL